MGHEFGKIRPIGGLDYDSENRLIEQGDYRYAENIRNSIGDTGKGGVVSNVLGNTLIAKYSCPYSTGYTYPAGTNQTIGYVEDDKNDSIVFFSWNSNNNHGIYRYWRNRVDSNNPYGVVEQVVQYDFGWQQDERITSASLVYGATGDLCYWTDSVMPRKINLTKGNVVTDANGTPKIKCWDLYLPQTIQGSIWDSFNITAKDFSGNVLYTKNLNKTLFVQKTAQIQISAVNHGGLYPYTQWVITVFADIDFTGQNTFQVSGSNFAVNNRSWGIVTFSNGLGVTVINTTSINASGNQPIPPTTDGHGDVFMGVISYYTPAASNDRDSILQALASQIKNDPDNATLTATACACHLEICESVAGMVWTLETDNPQIIISADNWYGAVLIDRFFDRCKYPFMMPPIMLYSIDGNYEPNYVKNKVFQSRLQPRYDDNEGTDLALGVWSQIPINNLTCDGTSDVSYNYIDINFNDDTIANAQTLVLLKKITLVMCEHNSNLRVGNRSILELEPCDFLDYDYDNSKWICHYKFYNDIISSPINDALAAKLFDDIPLKSDAELYVKNKIVDAGILEGYDAPACVNAKAQMEFADTPNPKLYKITGLIRVFNPYGDGNSDFTPQTTQPNILERRMPILYDQNQFEGDDVPYPFFGGYLAPEIYAEQAVKGKRQLLPEGGWAVYAAGTDYYTVSKQVIRNGLTQRGDGSIDVASSGTQNRLVAFYNNGTDDLFSQFEMLVPNGEYIIRLASHWCSFGDKLKKGFMYDLSVGRSFHQTSTYVWGVNDATVGNVWKADYEIKVTVNNGDVYIGEFVVQDLLVPLDDTGANRGLFQSISGYLFDNYGATDVVSVSKGVTVEKAYTSVIQDGVPYVPATTYQNRYTDHNGFFYFQYVVGGGSSNISYYNRVNAFQVSGTAIHSAGIQYFEDTKGLSALSLLFSGTITTNEDRSGNPSTHREIICPTEDSNARGRASTFIVGLVRNTAGEALSGVSVVFAHGGTATTLGDGSFSLLAWGDLTQSLTANSRIDSLLFSLPLSCDPIYISPQSVILNIDPFGTNTTTTAPPYSPTAFFDIGARLINEQNNPAVKAHKRGGNYTYVGRLYDDAGRLCSCFRLFEAYVPFIAEDIGSYQIEDFSGAIYPANTFKYGKPSIKWVLDSTTIFPTWATTFQLMRVKNSIYGRYLQWVANQVTYLSALATTSTTEIKTEFENKNAAAIKISISNIIDYFSTNNNSDIGYSYQAGDRVRLIADRSLVNYSSANFAGIQGNITDFEVTSYDSATQELIVKPNGFALEIQSGCLFEVFNPKSVSTDDEQIFYEVGESVKITDGIPETFSGVLTNGDTYWRGRLIIVNDDATKFASAYPVVIEDASVSDFYISKDEDIGRIGVIDPNFKQIYNPSKLRVSNSYQESSSHNGLSSMEELNVRELDKAYGTIKKLAFINNNLVCVMESKEVSNYIGLVTLMQASRGADAGLIATSADFFGTEYVHKQMLGTDFAGSIAISNAGIMFGLNSKSSNAWKYTDDEQVISDVKMVNYFVDLSKDGVSDVASIYDRWREEYILTITRNKEFQCETFRSTPTTGGQNVDLIFYGKHEIPAEGTSVTIKFNNGDTLVGSVASNYQHNGFDVIVVFVADDILVQDSLGATMSYQVKDTLAWNDTKKRWTTFYSFAPECYGILGSELFSFKSGKLWIHDTSVVRNNFYSEQNKTKLSVVFNQEPDKVKVWNTTTLMTQQSDGKNNWSAPVIKNNNGQLSRLVKGSWKKLEEFWYAYFKRDLNTVAVANPIIEGRSLRSTILQVDLENDFDGDMVLYSFDANYTLSERTSK